MINALKTFFNKPLQPLAPIYLSHFSFHNPVPLLEGSTFRGIVVQCAPYVKVEITQGAYVGYTCVFPLDRHLAYLVSHPEVGVGASVLIVYEGLKPLDKGSWIGMPYHKYKLAYEPTRK